MNYTRFEKARLVGARALQLSMGAPALIKTDLKDPIAIARKELEVDALPIAVRRPGVGQRIC